MRVLKLKRGVREREVRREMKWTCGYAAGRANGLISEREQFG